MPNRTTILEGSLFDDPRTPPRHGWLCVRAGRIEERGEGPPPIPADVGGADRLITPGFIDAHVHLPQIGCVGCKSGDLLAWLDGVIFPAESRWADPGHARSEMLTAMKRMFAAGTLGGAAYLTSHAHGPRLLNDLHAALPLRLHVGQTAMDRHAPADLIGEPLATLPDDTPRLHFSINPRFAISCTPALMERLGREARERKCLIQTHLAEQPAECAVVAELFPDAKSYAHVYDHFELLGPRSLLAHAIHLSPQEWALLASRGAAVVHCPAANTFLQSGVFDLAAARHAGVRVGLGTDVAAGADLAMPRAARAMIEVATIRRLLADPADHPGTEVPDAAEAWQMITTGNAQLLGFHDHGRLAPGDRADLLILRPQVPFDRHLAGRLIFGWDDAMIEHRLLDGRLTSISHRYSVGR